MADGHPRREWSMIRVRRLWGEISYAQWRMLAPRTHSEIPAREPSRQRPVVDRLEAVYSLSARRA
jgi:hypothetical protein